MSQQNSKTSIQFPPQPDAIARRLDVESFRRAFKLEFDKVTNRFFKFERLESYVQPEDPSYQAFCRKDLGLASKLLREGIAAQLPLYRSLQDKKALFVRVRVVSFPVSEYLL